MTGILDTHTLVWWDGEPKKLSAAAFAFIQDHANTVLLSAASIWEIIIKEKHGKMTLTAPLRQILLRQQSNRIQMLAITLDHVLAVEGLPPAHKDPFDRLLVAQANVEQAVLVTKDPIFAQYPVSVLW